MVLTLDSLEMTPGERQAAEDAVRRMAYSRWEESGRPWGDSLRFWKEAEETWILTKGSKILHGLAADLRSIAHRDSIGETYGGPDQELLLPSEERPVEPSHDDLLYRGLEPSPH